MGLTYRTYLEENSSIFGCSKCKTHLSTSASIISRQFHGQHGQAYLFESVVNVVFGKAEDREMVTGLHRVKDIACIRCSTLLGWAYVKAYSSDNKYKEGKFILEKKLLTDLLPKMYS
ncbi:hypothetical protein RO3G_07268 [Rhizopus delemar RA 99-880]|uniref:Protein yippee-like n=1 Tax=Rhizopus delemar (strain RA 99-880 / ATCC MYA-4621 / FGSC 9543 / NRRL 43880) TaxID=246409 RepID=I1C283_RHIO9|nr:hypothetical protein RO3G_07268 [Rhizopus delemar RA 99-880]|eukprot:EIE82563.1 hypothetical protein RO3G_07268 [Rhizopus delemar RA 99-880]